MPYYVGFLSEVASRLAISSFNVQDYAPCVAAGLINVLQTLLFLLWALIDSLTEEKVHNMLYLHS